MSLEKTFEETLDNWSLGDSTLTELLEQCVSITDDVAKDFARMLIKRFLDTDNLSEGQELRLEFDYCEYKRINNL